MTFSEMLNQYIDELGCSAKDLAGASGISAAVISRYRSGARVPDIESENLSMLAEGIARLSGGSDSYSADAVLRNFTELLEVSDFDYDRLADNLNQLIEAADLNINRLARFMNYDASFLSRIRTGQRRPADTDKFIDGVARFVSTNAADKIPALAALIGKSAETLEDQRFFYSELCNWLCSGKPKRQDSVDHFLNVLDQFDLNDYIASIKFNELKVPTAPFHFPTAKHYYGIEQMRSGELDFFKATVLSRSDESVFMCADMDIEDMAKNVDFGKKWMFAIAMCIKKGLHLNMIHTIDRPMNELMLGLESWIPIYMTGQISPYYLKNAKSSVYQHLNYVSGAAALTGECIVGQHSKGKYYLTKKPDEIAYYREKSEFILKKALPLMEIYRAEKRQQFAEFIDSNIKTSGKRHGILSVPPIYTIPEDLLFNILAENALSDEESERIIEYVQTVKSRMEEILQDEPVLDELPRLSPEEFKAHPASLSLEGLFSDKSVKYTYEEYCSHLSATSAYAEEYENYTVSFRVRRTFRNIQIFIHEGKYAMLSKGNAPIIHFVIRQPKLREAIENMVLPIVEEE